MNKCCDMCGTQIKDSKCACGIWITEEEMEDNPMRKSIERFHAMKKLILTGDAPHLGCAVVFFRGDYNDCKEVEKFILTRKGRPHYKEDV